MQYIIRKEFHDIFYDFSFVLIDKYKAKIVINEQYAMLLKRYVRPLF